MDNLIDKAKILRLLDEADDIVSALYRQGANKDYKCKSLREKLKAIETELQNIRQNDDYALIHELINREQAGKNICKYCASEAYCKEDDCMVYQGLRDTPTIQIESEVRHGRWIVHTTWHGMFGLIHSECSECKFDRNGDLSSWKFCPNCGAKMDLRTPTEVELDIVDSVMMGDVHNDT